jgi:hypothetical protein
VKQAIEKIIHLVTSTVHPNNTVNLDLSASGLNTLIDTVSIDQENIKRDLIDKLLNHQAQCELDTIVQNYQLLIIKLLNDLYAYRCNPSTSGNVYNLYSSLSDILVDILAFIETHLSKYFNLDVEIPHLHYSPNRAHFEQQFNALITAFKDSLEDLELITIVSSHYALRPDNIHKKSFTFRDLKHLKELIRELHHIVLKSSVYKSVKELLLHNNYNHIEFFKYLVDKLHGEYNNLETLDAKLELLKYQRKVFRQMQLQNNFALFSQLPSIKEQILIWIDEEVLFMEGQIKPGNQEAKTEDKEPVSEPKITVALSVAQLAFLIRVLTLGKVITNYNQSDVIRVFASNFKTYKTEVISYGSLYGKYFKPEASTIREVKGILLQLIGLVTKIKE